MPFPLYIANNRPRLWQSFVTISLIWLRHLETLVA